MLTTMSILPFRTSTYARNIYIFGTTTFAQIPAEYVIPVEQYAAATYSLSQIDNALASEYIDQQHYDDTIDYR
jgi:hypothetical protein